MNRPKRRPNIAKAARTISEYWQERKLRKAQVEEEEQDVPCNTDCIQCLLGQEHIECKCMKNPTRCACSVCYSPPIEHFKFCENCVTRQVKKNHLLCSHCERKMFGA